MNTTRDAAGPRSLLASMNSLDTNGQMSVQCESMNVSTTVRPRKLARETGWPDWSVSVNPGAVTCGTGESCISLARDVLTLAGIPDGRGGWFLPFSLVTANANTVANATPASNALAVSRTVDRLIRRRDVRPLAQGRGPGTCRPGPLASPACAGESASCSPATWSVSFIRKAPFRPAPERRQGYRLILVQRRGHVWLSVAAATATTSRNSELAG